jgi:acetolactate synthase I/III small subunit
MSNLYFISMTTDSTLRVLQRMASVFSRSRVNFEQLNIFEGKSVHLSQINVAIYTKVELIENLIKQLGKIVELHEVHVRSAKEHLQQKLDERKTK